MTAATSHGTGILDGIGDAVARTRTGVAHWISIHRSALIWLLPTLAVSAVVSFVNIGGSPQRIDDEGTYTAQAWAVAKLGELAHYTFWYDHPPVGWLQLAGYTSLTGAFERYDIAVLAAREAVIVASLISVVLVWTLSRRLGLRRPAAAVASLVFAISPLALQFHRTVYLDNVATPWLLLAFVLALSKRWQLAAFAGAAVAFGIAVLSKETYLLALPFLIWMVIRSSHRETRRYTLAVASSILVLIGGSYLLLAAVKGELLPGANRVSLLDGLMFQLSGRVGSGSIFDPDSLINRTLSMWWNLDPALIVLTIVSSVLGLMIRRLRPLAVMLLALTAFMFRPGGYLPVPYVIMLLPFAAVMVAGVADVAIRRLQVRDRKWRPLAIATVTVTSLAIAAALPLWFVQLRGFLLADLDAPMRNAQTWVADNVSRDDRLIVDDAMWVDLVRAGWDRENVVWYYKVDTDPAVQAESPEGWRDADYIVTTDSMRTFPDSFPQVQQAVQNSVVVASFGENTQQVQVRRIVAEGADSAKAEDAAAAEARRTEGAELATNPDVQMRDAARQRLLDGRVDSRIVLTLGATAAAAGGIDVQAFPMINGEDAGPLRTVIISSIGGKPVADGRSMSTSANSFIDSLTGTFAPAKVALVNGQLVLTYSVSEGSTAP